MDESLTKPCNVCAGTGRVLDSAKIGAQQRQKRNGHGVTLQELSREMDTAVGYLSDLERGRPGRNWSPSLVERYDQALQEIVSQKSSKQ